MPTQEDLREFLRTRRTVRRFKPDPVPDSVIEDILKTAALAPSAHNLKPWRFTVAQTDEAKQRLGKALTAQMRKDMQTEGADESAIQTRVDNSLRRISEAPVVIVLSRDTTAVRTNKPEDVIMSVQSVAAAGLQLLLAAHAHGLGGNWICWPLYAQEATVHALELPEAWKPEAMFFVGEKTGDERQ